jgi:hypothetical protein
MQQQALGVSIETPPFSALFTLWLSMMVADGLAPAENRRSRARSRHLM